MSDTSRLVANRQSLRFERSLALIFALLGTLLTALVAAHWFLVLEPTLREEAQSRSRAMAQAQTQGIEELFGRDPSPDSLREELRVALDSILLLKDQATDKPFIRGITLSLDYDFLDVPRESLDLVLGVEQCADCFVAQIPIYHPSDRLLIGIVTYYSSPEFLQTIVHAVRGKLLWGGLTILCTIGLAWVGASRLLGRLGESEVNLRNVFEAAPFPMVLNERGQVGLTKANRAAVAYLDLKEEGSGQLTSEAWLTLYATGLPSQPGESREVCIPAANDGQRWALVSAIPLSFSGVASQLISLADISELKATQDELRSASHTDSLTGLFNRRYLLLQLAKEIDLVKRYNLSLSIILLDLDHFKSINDLHGHRVGDDVLVKVAEVLRASVREVDVAGRYGGEEFLVILPNSGLAEAVEAAERIRAVIRSLAWPNLPIRVTASFGVCRYDGKDIDEFIAVADGKLYQAKAAGRDRIVWES